MRLLVSILGFCVSLSILAAPLPEIDALFQTYNKHQVIACESPIVNIKGNTMKLVSQIIIFCCLISLANTKLFAKSMTVLDFEQIPFSGKVSEKELRKLS